MRERSEEMLKRDIEYATGRKFDEVKALYPKWTAAVLAHKIEIRKAA